ncbi:TetR family transcriptional regulator [Nostoc linckia z18]|jgi:AcrR family transcriptional regulator|uniref:TetR family transcriptional regulator n=2 Tax=Nostoc linckia TaxID=92942 RepID=A0A9Q5ZBB7_NOSLI|nr:TetR/AcrR family transcriptional regulator [Nostoc linckia]PHK27609.1 TetR family transcriptional regulator [Nostoc linckia z15]PHK39796.1 TetR family transcriptional regulator [Nostoc linckia z16]PHJ63045.1 TetR family transcriptional regulator [Nostoc linckia z1]PHJ72229.1 TetR family transcriptional regulator [Nostoc linckia z3]PHJ75669.1 TetR family transcriptional regulator [Nostoc linckia z2]
MNKAIRSSALTRKRLIEAASQVFASLGVQGATTREIARVASVNEVTLFRHFASKEQLLGAVIENVLALQIESLAHPEAWTQDLKIDLERYAQLYNTMLESHEDLIRTFIGEAKRHPEAARQVIQEAAKPLGEKLVAYLQCGQRRGIVRADIDPFPAVDMFTGMLLAGMLCRTAKFNQANYSCERYIETCVDIFVRGISITPL